MVTCLVVLSGEAAKNNYGSQQHGAPSLVYLASSPFMNDSVFAWQRSSLYCTGGVFMK
jgi:hypothetical protein